MMTASASFLLLLSLIAGYCCEPLSWEQVNTARGFIRNRWFAGSAFANGHLFIFGGEGSKLSSNDSGILGDTWKADLAGNPVTWEQVSSLTGDSPSPRYGFVSGVVGGYWIISHGCDLNKCFSDTWAMDISSPSNPSDWMILINSSNYSEPIPTARFTRAGGVYPGEEQLWISMGESESGRKLSDTWILEVNLTDGISAFWTQVSAGSGLNQYNPYLPSARSLLAGAPINTSTFAIFGGCASGGGVGGPCPVQDVWTLDLTSGTWDPFPTCLSPRVRSNMIAVPGNPGRAFILEGSQTYTPGIFPQQIVPKDYNDTEIFIMNAVETNVNLSEWKRVFVQGPVPGRREGSSLAVDVDEGVVYLIGGRLVEDSTLQLDVWKLRGNILADQHEGCPAPQFTYVHLHGLLMYLAWGLLIPLGSLLGRYYRWTWPCWFIFHMIFQSLGVLLTVAGFVIIYLVGSYTPPDFPHAIVGIVLTFLLLQQFLSGVFHPCVDKENGKTPSRDKTYYRKCWEVYHAISGFITIGIGFGQLMLGVLLVVGPMALWIVWAALGSAWILTFLLHEVVYICYHIVQGIRKCTKNVH